MPICVSNPQKVAYFIHHHGVVSESSLTTKLRVVFNLRSPAISGVSSIIYKCKDLLYKMIWSQFFFGLEKINMSLPQM